MSEPETPRLSPSIAKILLNQSPKHAYAAHRLLGGAGKDKPSASQALGSAVDAMLSGTELDCTDAVRAKAAPIAGAVKDVLERSSIGGIWQIRHLWSSGGDVLCSGVLDLVDYDAGKFYDLKTAHDLSDAGITKSIELYHYDLQMAAYSEALDSTIYKGYVPAFIFAETAPPYDVRIIGMSPRMLGNGTAKWLKAVRIWKDCLSSGNWPGRGDTVLEPSQWAKNEAWLP